MNDCGATYYWGVCSVCKDTESLRVCGRCKLIYYCSRKHQKLHWPAHKNICACINQQIIDQKSLRLYQNAYQCSSGKEWNTIRTRAALLTELGLGRKLAPFERQMFMFPKVCEVCKNDDQKTLICCDKCYCVSYCSTDHQKEDAQHADRCSSLQLCKSLDLKINDTHYLKFLNILASLHFTECGFPQNMDEFLTNFAFIAETCNLQKKKVQCSELLSCPLTLLYALKLIGKVSSGNRKLTVHIVGASDLECGLPNMWQTICHWLPQIFKLHIVFVGPEVVVPSYKIHPCEDCDENKIDLKLEFHNVLYHDYIKSKDLCPPDVIVAFNCGFQENKESSNDIWKATLPTFFKFTDAHIIFTSYTKLEAEKDLDILLSSGHNSNKVLFQHIINPYRSNRPHRDWDQFKSDVFFINKYLSIVHVTS